MMTLQDLKQLSKAEAKALLSTCCGSAKWVKAMLNAMPFKDEYNLVKTADETWYNKCGEKDWREAFDHHPKIGGKAKPGEKLAAAEQSSVASATQVVKNRLAAKNKVYEKQYGFIFIVCATGRSAEEMLQLLELRLRNGKDEELHIAMNEQQKITLIRLKKMLPGASWQTLPASQLTTHVLDTGFGRPALLMPVSLQCFVKGNWRSIAQGITNADGRIGDLLPALHRLKGTYKMLFDTGAYFAVKQIQGFYPKVEIQFTITDTSHHHIPLLISPFGFTTYRGS